MKKWQMFFIITILGLISFFITYYTLLPNYDENWVFCVSGLCFLIPGYLYLIVFLIIKLKHNIENRNVTNASEIIKRVERVNEEYYFLFISKKKHFISKKKNIKKYLDTDKDNLRTDIENALFNMKLYDKYLWSIRGVCDIDSIFNDKVIDKEIEKLNEFITDSVKSINEVDYNNKKFRRIEKRVLKKLIHSKDDFGVKLEVKNTTYSFDKVVEIYNEWLNEDNSKYKVINKDNFNCKLLGNEAFNTKMVLCEDNFCKLLTL